MKCIRCFSDIQLLFCLAVATVKRLAILFLVIIALVGCAGDSSSDNDDFTTDATGDDSSNSDYNYTDLRTYQWHLVNTGQETFATYSGTVGEDMNQETAYAEETTGKGVIVAIVDTGLEIAHVDLSDNIVSGESWNFLDNSTDPTCSDTDGDHGTSVAGLIGALDNKVGGRGVAPAVSLKGFNLLSSTQTTTQEIAALGGSSSRPSSSDVDIFNMSYGYENNYDFKIDEDVEDQFIYGVNYLRDEKGAIYVKSNGNGFESFGTASCDDANDHGLTCQNGNMDPENAIPWVISVAALNADGIKSSYSTAGSNTWISAPGGEFGINQSYLESLGYSIDDVDEYFEPALVTTDQTGCDSGYAQNHNSSVETSLYNAFQSNDNDLNDNCSFTSVFNGSSSAAPLVSGSIALMLEANSNLTWRDVKHILATTARVVDSSESGVSISMDDGETIVADYGWVENRAGYHFHNWYGFGAIDVDEAVEMAKNYTANSLGTLSSVIITSDTLSSTIPDASSDGCTETLYVEDDLTIESVQITISITHSNVGDIGISLTSPEGTSTVLLNVMNGFSGTEDLDEMVLLSNTFYGESSKGTWTLKIVDAKENTPGGHGSTPGRSKDGTSGGSEDGTLNNWKLTIYGH